MSKGRRSELKAAETAGKDERILLAAEKVFAEKTFDGASLREIAREADVPISLASYYFGTKESLFQTIIQRRSGVVVDHRRKLLLIERNAANPGPIPVERIIYAYVMPFLERAQSGGPEWENYTRLISHTATSRTWSPVISKYYDDVVMEFLSELARTLPRASQAELVYSFTYVVSSMLGVAARTLRSDRLSDGAVRADDIEAATEVLVRFLAGGFSSIDRGAACELGD